MPRIRLTFQNTNPIPINQQYYLQGNIYRWLRSVNETYSDMLHNSKGIKPFVFGLIKSNKHKIFGSEIMHFGSTSWTISSSDNDFFENLINGIKLQPEIIIGNQKIPIEQLVQYSFESLGIKDEMVCRCLSPIALKHREKSKYILPSDEEYAPMLLHNIKHKTNEDIADFEVIYDKNWKSKMMEYKTYKILCVETKLILRGSNHLIHKVYDSGLGINNPGGFGMIELDGINNA